MLWKSDKDGNHFTNKPKKQLSGVKSSVESSGISQHKFLKRHEIVDSEGNHIPDSPWYVILIDKFLSGWGMAEGKKNRLVIPVKSLREGELVKQEAETRDDFTSVNVVEKIPNFDYRKNYVQLKTREDMPKLFKKVYFEETGQHWRP